jgi:arylsulfatase A-like enzyme
MQNYWGEIAGIDRAMGKLRRRLRELGVADDTLLLYTSDNGANTPGSTGGLRGKKGALWEGGIRVPGLLEWPGRVKEPRVVTVPCGTVDILPTVLAAAGVDYPQAGRPLDGESLLPIIDGKATERTKPLGFWTYISRGKGMKSSNILQELEKADPTGTGGGMPPLSDDEKKAFAAKYPSEEFPGHAAWVDGRYKLHRLPKGKQGGDAFELYDLVDDANETNDLAGAQPERVKAMASTLEAWQRSVLHSLNGGDDDAP